MPTCRKRKSGGRGVGSLVHRALLPGTLYTLQKRRQRRTRRRRRGGKKYRKGSPSKTRRGRKDFRTHKGDNVFDRLQHWVRGSRKPFTRRRRRRRRRRR
jgi:hypothetical protein